MRACLWPTAEYLGGKVARGAAWMGALIAGRALLTLGSTAILARLLTPADYGLAAMSSVVTEIAGAFCIVGVPQILIQMPRLRRLELDTAAAALFMGAGVVALDAMDIVPHSQPFVELLILVASGVLLFFAGLFVISRSSLSELWSIRRLLRTN